MLVRVKNVWCRRGRSIQKTCSWAGEKRWAAAPGAGQKLWGHRPPTLVGPDLTGMDAEGKHVEIPVLLLPSP